MYNEFISILHLIIEKHFPFTKHKSSRRNKMPLNIKRLLQIKLKTYKEFKKDKSLKFKYKRVVKDYELAVAKWHDESELNLCKNPSTKKFYNYVKKKINSHTSIPPLTDNKGKLWTTDNQKAEAFNKFFQSVFTTDNGKNLNLSPKSCKPMENFYFTQEDIISAMQNMKPKVSRTPEDIPTLFIKRCLPALIGPLTFIFNLIFHYNYIPKQWKTAIVIPIFKKQNKHNVENFRPISLTSGFCRLFESVIHEKILAHLKLNNLLSRNQFGFLPNRNTGSQLLTCLFHWLNPPPKTPTHVIYTDFSKAFDSVSHPKLIQNLTSYEINQILINWISNFLTDRHQVVAINNTLSSPLPVSSGVPQGSVLGPLLFTIFINDIVDGSQLLGDTGDIVLFADDMKLYSTDIKKLQTTLDFITTWTKTRQLNLADNKCFSFQISKPINSIPVKFKIDQTELKSSILVKDLGIFISQDLKWTHHINFIYKKASSILYQILKTFSTKNIWTLLKLYVTYIRPKLEHNTTVWSPFLKKDIRKLESVQRKFTRVAFLRCGIHFDSYEDRLFKLGLKSLAYRRTEFDLKLMYKIVNGLSDLKFEDFFVYKPIPYNIRGGSVKIETRINLKDSNWRNSFYVRTIKIWNFLPQDLKSASNFSCFKRKLNCFDLTPYVAKV